MSTPAGWYLQPDDQQRYWDGEQWTEHFAPRPLMTPTVVGPAIPPGLTQQNWFLRHKVITAVGAFLLLATFVGMASGGDTKSTVTAPVAVAVATSAAPDQAALDRAAADQAAADQAAEDQVAADKAAEDQVAADKATADRVAAQKAAASAAASSAPEVFRMPDLVGENLQLGQDTLQALGSYVVDQEDAAGLSRAQVLDSNWQICAQTPAPGRTVPVETVVLLSSVKLAEQCP